MEGLAHYDDPTAGWPDPEHTTLQQAVAAFAAAAAAQDPHGLHHHHHPFGDLGTSSNGPDVSRAPGNVQQHDNHDSHHNITLAGAAAAAGGMNMPLGSLDLSTNQHLPPFPTSAHHHLGNPNFSLGSPPQHILPTPANLSQYSHEQNLATAAAAAADAQAKKQEKKERKRREKAEVKRQAEEQARITAIASQANSTISNTALDSTAVPSAQHASSSTQRSDLTLPSAINSTVRSLAASFEPDHSDAIVRRRGNGDDEGPITDVNEWLAGSWLKGPALRKVAKEKG